MDTYANRLFNTLLIGSKDFMTLEELLRCMILCKSIRKDLFKDLHFEIHSRMSKHFFDKLKRQKITSYINSESEQINELNRINSRLLLPIKKRKIEKIFSYVAENMEFIRSQTAYINLLKELKRKLLYFRTKNILLEDKYNLILLD
jgi:hypothetical protein